MLQHMRQKHQNDAFWLKLQKLTGPGWHPHDVLKAWVRVCPRVPCCKSQPDGHFVYKPAYLPQIAATFGGVQDYCGDLFEICRTGSGYAFFLLRLSWACFKQERRFSVCITIK